MTEKRNCNCVRLNEVGGQKFLKAKAELSNENNQTCTFPDIYIKSGVSPRTLRRFLNGEQSLSIHSAIRLATVLKIQLTDDDLEKTEHDCQEQINSDSSTALNWLEICNKMLEPQRRLISDSLIYAYEDDQFEREKIYVQMALVESKKPDKVKDIFDYSDDDSQNESQQFEHEAFLQEILARGKGKTKGKQIALIGEAGAGKTTLLQTIADWVLEQDLGLPIWVSLADLEQNGTLNIWDYLQLTWLSLATSPTEKTIAESELRQKIEQGQVWLLLDGLDKVAISQIQNQLQQG